MKTWYIDEGIMTVRAVQDIAKKFGYHATIGGGVINKGSSKKDLDLWFLPLNGLNYRDDNKGDSSGLLEALAKVWGTPHKIDYPEDSAPDPNANPFIVDELAEWRANLPEPQWEVIMEQDPNGRNRFIRRPIRIQRQAGFPDDCRETRPAKEPHKQLYAHAVTFLRNDKERIDCFIL